MNYYDSLNKIISTIENKLTEKIDYKELAKIIGTSSYAMQRIFVFLTGITLTEYIRKRRLSMAGEDVLKTNEKIIDLSLKYQYDSAISFSNAFKKMHGITPSEARKNKINLKIFPPINFEPINNVIDEVEYRIMETDEQTFYGVTTGIIDRDDHKTVSNLFDKCRANQTLDYIINNSDGDKLYYGLSQDIYSEDILQDKIKYYILGKEYREDFVKVKLAKATWACFKVDTKNQNDILQIYDFIYGKWLPQSKYKDILEYPQLEIYYKDYCEICIAVE